ncbi:cytochrome C biogenesis protein [Oleiharenicola lentus]|uniref:Cytochrome C biogenesis protein n=1 Tax=Oleiharenicola lentus TaxID=2508720 RepID=A0A4Q1C9K8_9BACT|nr:cytochrome c biogenesis protein CcsA [Oleiharenicola lentus]RXK55521.1 cytochrome C biogenesis protein [Oleiharenicola lentus]
MKRFLPLVILLLGAAYLLSTLRPEKNTTQFDLAGFGEVPVLVNGRIKPLDTVARTSLLTLQGRQRVSSPETGTLVDSPAEWLATVFFNPTKADDLPTIKIESPEVLTLLGLEEKDTRIDYDSTVKKTFAVLGFLPSSKSRFSYNQLKAKLPELDRQGRLAEPVEAQLRTPFQKQVITVRNRVILYLQLRLAVQMPESTSFLTELELFERALPAGVAAVLARQKNEAHDENALKVMKEMADRFAYMEQLGHLRLVPPAAGDSDPTHWELTGTKLLESFGTGKIDPTVMNYARLGEAWRKGDTATFNRIVGTLHDEITPRYPEAMRKSDIESRFNAAGPFYSSMTLYVWAFLLAIISWLKWPQELGRGAMWLLSLAFVATSAGIFARMWLEGRPPVTNLYSSALFVGWGAVFLCLILEWVFKNAIGSVAGGLIGFATLLIAHHLSFSGDTMEMMRAVLDSNFWLATHVIIITIGYSATFLAGFLAAIYILRGLFTKTLDKATADALTRMVYGIVCFATLFSLVGTVLGGIWADQSWGRFWGWDPKENGALLIVIWNAVILHARWGGLVKQRGLMGLAIFGNIVTSWSWFGTNMLGVGLHSYGFMDAAFYWLIAFVASQVLIIALAVIPQEKWRSFRNAVA